MTTPDTGLDPWARTGENWLGDVARAAEALEADTAEDWRRIARLLGLGEESASVTDGGPEPENNDPTSYDRADTPDPWDGARSETVAEDGGDTVEDVGRRWPAPLLAPVERRPAQTTGWQINPLARPRQRSGADDGRLPLPLLAPRSCAAVLKAALARVTPEGELDIEQAAEQLGRGLPLDEIPRMPLPTLRFGVQVLADTSASMEPFARDVDEVVRQVRALVGTAGTQTLYFADSPLRGAGPGARDTWRPYRPPQPGTRVLILSLMGAAGPALHAHRARERDWREVVRRVRQYGCQAIALTPLPERLWPSWWNGLLPVVVWDRGTTVGRVIGTVR